MELVINLPFSIFLFAIYSAIRDMNNLSHRLETLYIYWLVYVRLDNVN